MHEYIKLQNANAFQLTDNGKRSNWVIRENQTDNKLFEFASNISDEVMFSILDFSRMFELEAFNNGIQFERSKTKNLRSENESLKQYIKDMNQKIGYLEAEISNAQV